MARDWKSTFREAITSPRARDAVLSVSLANLCFLSMWAALQDQVALYFRKVAPAHSEVFALALDTLILAAAFYACLSLARRIGNPWIAAALRIVFLVFLLVPIRNIRWQFPAVSTKPVRDLLGHSGVLFAGVLLAVALLYWNRRATRIAATLLLILAPLVPINLARSLALAHSLRSAFREEAPRMAHGPAPVASRVVVLLFDELDYRLAFAARPPALELPNLDRLRRESVFAVNAHSAQKETILSIPAILSGREVTSVTHRGADDLVLHSPNETVEWNRIPNLFSEARNAGIRTALSGWFHPYCRVLGNALDECYYEPGVSDRPEWARSIPLTTSMWLYARRQLSYVPFVHSLRDTRGIARPEHIREYREIHRRALGAAIDPAFGFVFLHYPIPHLPGIFDAATHRLAPEEVHHYADNLGLVDQTLGEVRTAMERAGVWERTTLILTADHPLRLYYWPEESEIWGSESSPLVPFAVKLQGQTQGITFTSAINNKVIHELVPELLLRGRGIRKPEDLVHWLEIHSAGDRQQLASETHGGGRTP